MDSQVSGNTLKVAVDYRELIVRVLEPVRACVFAERENTVREKKIMQSGKEQFEVLHVVKGVMRDRCSHGTKWKVRAVEIARKIENASETRRPALPLSQPQRGQREIAPEGLAGNSSLNCESLYPASSRTKHEKRVKCSGVPFCDAGPPIDFYVATCQSMQVAPNDE
jgi:hypothetical protein